MRLHLAFGWGALALFSAMGLGLHGMHALGIPEYTAPGVETRRLMWTLAHTHGTLLGLLHIGFAFTLPAGVPLSGRLRGASRLLTLALILLPAGFVLGGVTIHGGDPGRGVILVPLGALALILACVLAVPVGSRLAEPESGASP